MMEGSELRAFRAPRRQLDGEPFLIRALPSPTFPSMNPLYVLGVWLLRWSHSQTGEKRAPGEQSESPCPKNRRLVNCAYVQTATDVAEGLIRPAEAGETHVERSGPKSFKVL